ncbi:MAG: hypothetical protein QXH08_01320 [Candidatus Hadarchaeales archaeon]
MDGKIVRQEKCFTYRRKSFLKWLPKGTKVTLESAGFYWPWIKF